MHCHATSFTCAGSTCPGAPPVATGVAVRAGRRPRPGIRADDARELGWFYRVKTLGAVKAEPWGSLSVFSFSAGSLPPPGVDFSNDFEFARECMCRS